MLRSIGLARLCRSPASCFQRAFSAPRRGAEQRLSNQLAESLTYEMHPGARLYVINQKNLDKHPVQALTALKNSLLEVRKNDAVGIVVIKVKRMSLLPSVEQFGGSQHTDKYKTALAALDEFPGIIGKMGMPVVVIYCDVVNSAFSAFSSAKVRSMSFRSRLSRLLDCANYAAHCAVFAPSFPYPPPIPVALSLLLPPPRLAPQNYC